VTYRKGNRGGPRRLIAAPGGPTYERKPVKGVGRAGSRDYCERCRHTRRRCVCPTSIALTAALEDDGEWIPRAGDAGPGC
jgi:hypothetical protein